MPNNRTVTERRVQESWRSRACAAGLCVGAQVFLFGTGIAMPIALNSAWLAALAVLPAAACLAAACRKSAGKAPSRAAYALLFLTLMLNAVFAVSALIGFAEQTLLEQTPALWSVTVTVCAVALCALSGGEGVSRLCFALRWLLPVLIVLLVFFSMPMKIPDGLFPLMGPGAAQLGMAALCMLGASSPVLMLLLPPPDLAFAGEDAAACQLPSKAFFIRRVLLGTGAGILLLFAACVCTTYESIGESAAWGMRLRIVASDQPHEGIPQTILIILQMTAMVLLASSMLCAAEEALLQIKGNLKRMRLGLLLSGIFLFLTLILLTAFGFEILLAAAPVLIVPTAVVPALFGKRKDVPR